MFRLYSFRRARRAIEGEASFIGQVSEKYGLPASWIQAILLKEMTELDVFDLLADFAVRLYYFNCGIAGERKRFPNVPGKRDSSTGWSQIYAFVAINALNFAADRGLADYADFGLNPDRRLDRDCPEDRWQIWKRLKSDRHFNIEMCALNLLSCAEERTGRTDTSTFSEEECKLTFSRYNGTVPHVTPYGETVWQYQREYRRESM
ncbi:MAG: hypothetical protein K6C08_01550 [Oscillospiraceae bacterium]|nr:hypothetical protein [Oscillospiraceae bacterium]